MKANELRVGNWCQSPYEKKPFKIKAEHILQLEQGMDELSILGIPLTSEILVKAEFSDKDYKKGYIGIDIKSGHMTTDFVLTKPLVMGEWQTFYAFVYDNFRFIKIEYVHKLQDFFHAWSGGEELNIQL